jgi:hypothetical protein
MYKPVTYSEQNLPINQNCDVDDFPRSSRLKVTFKLITIPLNIAEKFNKAKIILE